MTTIWRHVFRFVMFGLGCGVACAAAAPVGRVAGFAELPEGDRLVVKFESFGCFHAMAFTLTYSRIGDGVCEIEVPPGQPPRHVLRHG